jgi:hypothetical protein
MNLHARTLDLEDPFWPVWPAIRAVATAPVAFACRLAA